MVVLSDQVVPGGPKYIPGYLRNISKKFSKNWKFFFTSKIFLGTSFRVADAKNLIFRAEITQNHPGGQKMRFFKVRDIDTIIEPGEKEHQTDVSSALKRFGDHPCRFWDIMKFWTAVPWFGPLLDFPYKVVVWGSKSRKLVTISKSAWVVTKPF